MCIQQTDSTVSGPDVMEQRNGSDSDKRNFKNRTGIFPHSENDRITESAESPGICGRLPFEYQKNCLLYLPKNLKTCRRESQEEAEMIADHIHSLICSTYGHTLVLFTSYHLMGNVYQMLRDEIPFPMIEVWRHSPEEITRFKQMDNAVLLQPAPVGKE